MSDAAEVLHLIPQGYPVTIDVAQQSIAGAGTAMHFTLPLHAHNLPLMHEREAKLVVALDGEVAVRSGGAIIALLRQGDAVLLQQHLAHRIHQHGAQPATVGVALWPGKVEEAFRQQAARVAAGAYGRDDMIALFAGYGVQWDAATGNEVIDVEIRPWAQWSGSMPPDLFNALRLKWPDTKP